MMVKRLADYYFENPIKAAQTAVPELRSRCDLLIALTHLPAGVDADLAAKVPGIDVIMAAHSHTIADPERVGQTTILRHGAWAHHVGRVTIDVVESDIVGADVVGSASSGERLVTVSDELIPLAKT
jgi:2',3'-cyclic-nucleotide 2'-phosphodiesterase (5'-nucleotidase family)